MPTCLVDELVIIHMDNLNTVNTTHRPGLMISRAMCVCYGHNQPSVFDQPSAPICNESVAVANTRCKAAIRRKGLTEKWSLCPIEWSSSPSASNLPAKLGVARMLEMLPEQHASGNKCGNESNTDELFYKRVMMPNEKLNDRRRKRKPERSRHAQISPGRERRSEAAVVGAHAVAVFEIIADTQLATAYCHRGLETKPPAHLLEPAKHPQRPDQDHRSA